MTAMGLLSLLIEPRIYLDFTTLSGDDAEAYSSASSRLELCSWEMSRL